MSRSVPRLRLAGAILVCGVVGLAGCASPPSDFYTLAAVPGPATPGPRSVRSIELRRIEIAGYLDRPEIVQSASGYRLRFSGRERWGEPVGGMIERVFTEDLVQRLPGTSVYAESGAITSRPDRVLEVDVLRFDRDASGELVLLAQVAVRHDSAVTPGTAETLRIVRTPTSDATPDLIAAMSAAIGELADRVASGLASE